jgi:hypothetical protein
MTDLILLAKEGNMAMLINLIPAVAVTLVLTMAAGRAGERKPQEAKNEQGILAEVRGTLHFENGRGYFISVKNVDSFKKEREIRVWLRAPENKVLIRKLEGLDGKEVIAKGQLGQMPGDVRASVPPLGIYLHFDFTIEHAEKAAPPNRPRE